MAFLVEGVTKDGNTLCGTETNIIIRDLKTIRGVVNRLKKFPLKGWMKRGITKIRISSYYSIFKEDTYTLVYENNIENLI